MAETSGPLPPLTFVEEVDALVKELKKLRIGAGVTGDKLGDSPTVMRALGNPPVIEAQSLLVSLIRRFKPGLSREALLCAFGIEVPQLPAGHEGHTVPLATRKLKDRRIAFGWKFERYDTSSIIRYEDAAIRELANMLAGAKLALGDGAQAFELGVWGYVIGNRFHNMVVSPVLAGEEDESKALGSMQVLKPASVDPAMHCMIYQLPAGRMPTVMFLSISFYRSPLPKIVWSVWSETLFGLVSGDHRHEAITVDDLASNIWSAPFDDLHPNYFYALYWEF